MPWLKARAWSRLNWGLADKHRLIPAGKQNRVGNSPLTDRPTERELQKMYSATPLAGRALSFPL